MYKKLVIVTRKTRLQELVERFNTQAGIVAGMLQSGEELVLESLMPSGGAAFSDGMEADFLQFNSGATAIVRAAEQRARLVVA
jgi:hypothetical protein